MNETLNTTTKPVFNKLDPPERSRKYVYADGTELTFSDVTAVHVSERGTHRLEMRGGPKAIIAPGWRAILLDVDDWTF